MTPRPSSDRSANSHPFAGRLAIGWIALALVAHAFTRIGPVDAPMHLATARRALADGAWPITNLFSYTHPDFPLWNTYPLYQMILLGIHTLGGWEGVSLLAGFGWIAVFALWAQWGGGWRALAAHPLLWTLALFGLQRRMLVRPDLLTFALLGLLLLLLDRFLADPMRRRAELWLGAPLLLAAMANTQPLFVLGLAVLALFSMDGARRRRGIPWDESVALLLSALACMASPLGPRIFLSPGVALNSQREFRPDVLEFLPLTQRPYDLVLVCLSWFFLGAVWWRRRPALFEAGLAALALSQALLAERGTALCVVVACALASRAQPCAADGFRRRASLVASAVLCLLVVHYRWIDPIRPLDGVQPGLGRRHGAWPVGVIDFLNRSRPPGRVLHTSWTAGIWLMGMVDPPVPVTVDTRFQAYPSDFLHRVIRADCDDGELARLRQETDALWWVDEFATADQAARAGRLLRSGEWRLVHYDTVAYVLVRVDPRTETYLQTHTLDLSQFEPKGFVRHLPDVYGQQLRRVNRFLSEIRPVVTMAPEDENLKVLVAR